MTEDPPPRDRRSLTTLARDLVNDAVTMVREEITLLRVEVAHNVRAFGRRLSQVMFGGSMALGGLLALGSFAVVGLGLLLGGRYWLSALLVGIVLFVGGGAVVFLGVRSIGRAMSPPRETIASLERTREWVGDELRSLDASRKLGRPGAAEPPAVAGTMMIPDGTALPAAGAPPPSTGVSLPGDRTTALEGPAAEGRRDAGAPGVRPLLRRLVAEIQSDDVPGQAAKIAYYMFLSLPPAFLVLFALTGIFGGDRVANLIVEQVQRVLPGSLDDPDSAAGLVSRFVEQVVYEKAPGPLSIGLVLGLWSSSAVFVAMADALNVAYDVEETRPWVRRRLMAVGVMLVFVLLFLSGSALIVAGPQIVDLLPFSDAARIVWNIAQWPAAGVLVVAAMFLVYYVLPNRDQRSARRPLLWSAAIATVLWLIGTSGFRIYVANFGSYSESYGFIGAILVLLLWMYLTGIIILVGGEIAAELEREKQT